MNPEFEMRVWAVNHYLAFPCTRNPFVILYNVLRLLICGLNPCEKAKSPLLHAYLDGR
jgi:hypothetical protein